MYRGLGEKLAEYLQSIGLNPLYVCAVFGILISLSYFKYFKTWKEEPWWRKWFAGCTIVGTAFMIFFSIMSLLGYM